MSNKIRALKSLVNHKYNAGSEIAGQAAQLEWLFAKLMVMGSEFEESMRLAKLLSSVMGQDNCAPIIGSINTLPESMAIWSYVTNIFMEECNRLKLVADTTKNWQARMAATKTQP